MIELVFGESPAGALKLAKSMKQGDQLTGAIAVFGGSKKEQRMAKKPRKWSGLTMEGSSKEVKSLTLALDIGDISDMNTGMNARKKMLDDLFANFSEFSNVIWKDNKDALNKIQESRSTLEPIRIWMSTSDPAETCGLYFICHFMLDSKTPLSVVRVPMQLEKDNNLFTYRSTGEIPAEEFGALIKYEEPLSQCQRSAYANIWSDLMIVNAPLRAIINGKIINAPTNFYDFALRGNIPAEEFRVAQLIGKTLNQLPGVGDHWLFLRIQAMIQSGELIEVSVATDEHPYSGVIKRNSKIERNI